MQIAPRMMKLETLLRRARDGAFACGREIGLGFEALLFPPACALCGTEMPGDGGLCASCRPLVPAFPPASCRLCARPFPKVRGSVSLCLRCRSRRPLFRRAVAATRFRGAARDLVHRYKYARERWLSRPLGHCLAERLREEPWIGEVDWIAAIPLHWRRARRRGFDQAEQLAGELSRELGIPALHCLARIRATPPQVRLLREARRRNLAGAFRARRTARVRGRRILLVDDVLTSGATADAAARALRSAGAKTVWAAAFAR